MCMSEESPKVVIHWEGNAKVQEIFMSHGYSHIEYFSVLIN